MSSSWMTCGRWLASIGFTGTWGRPGDSCEFPGLIWSGCWHNLLWRRRAWSTPLAFPGPVLPFSCDVTLPSNDALSTCIRTLGQGLGLERAEEVPHKRPVTSHMGTSAAARHRGRR